MKKVLMFLLIGTLAVLGGCGSDDPSSPSPITDDGNDNGVATIELYSTVQEAAPVFEPGASTTKAEFSDDAMRVAYQLLRSYTYPDDEGQVDMSNLYKVLWETNRMMDEAATRCDTLSAAVDQSISPFAFDDIMAQSYTMGFSEEGTGGYGSSLAYGVEGDEQQMLLSYKWAPQAAEQVSIGVIQAAYNDTTGAVSLRFAQSVRYPAGSEMGGPDGDGFAIRARIDGNAKTHTFELKIASGDVSLVGKGVASGAGNYILMRSGENFYCLPSEASEDDLAALTPTDLAGVPAGGADYKADVAAMSPFDTGSDLPAVDLSDFSGGTDGDPVSYLMF